MTGAVDLLCDGHVAEIVLRQPERRNAISADMWRRISEIATGDALRGMRCVVIRGEGDCFSAGADITGFEAGRGAGNAQDYDDLVEATARHVEALSMPVIAAISGHCIGAGASLACACDLRVAEASAYFAVPAARLGLGYDPRGISRFRRVFGDNATRQILFTAARLPAPRACELGAVAVLAEDGKARDDALALASRIAANAPLTLSAAKFVLREMAQGYEPSVAALAETAKADHSADYAEGRAAFSEKRPPRFEGQ